MARVKERKISEPRRPKTARLTALPIGTAITLVGVLLFLAALLSGRNSPAPDRVNQSSWAQFTDREAFGLDDGQILGVWRATGERAEGDGRSVQCGIRRLGVYPKALEVFRSGEAPGGWIFGKPEEASVVLPLLNEGAAFCDLPVRVSNGIIPQIQPALANPGNPRLEKISTLPDGSVMTMYAVVDLEGREAWTWMRVLPPKP
ncbi:MAG: hypothetical protein AAF830_03695 [Pseudomonadota bacterium]